MPDLERDLRDLFDRDASDVDPRSRERVLSRTVVAPAPAVHRRPLLYAGVVAAVVVLIMGIALVGRDRPVVPAPSPGPVVAPVPDDTPSPPPPVRPDPTTIDLTGTWNLEIVPHEPGDQGEPATYAGPMSITFGRDGTLVADDGCSLVRGTFVVGGTSVSFHDLRDTRRIDCGSDDPGLRQLLGRVHDVVGNADHPVLLDADGVRRLSLSDRLTSPRPGPITLAGFERAASAQDFRPYTGPTPPPFGEEQALAAFGDPSAASLGLLDVGMVHDDGRVDWTPVVVVADVPYLRDITAEMRGPGPGAPRPTPRPGWGREVTAYDAVTGQAVFGVSY